MKSGKFAVSIPIEEIKQFCQRWKIKEFYLFGSVLRNDFNENSDIDIIVKFFPNSNWSWKILDMDDELEQIFGRKVDVINQEVIEEDNNWLRRKNILSTATLVYEQEE